MAQRIQCCLWECFLLESLLHRAFDLWSCSVTKSCPALCEPIDFSMHNRLPSPPLSPWVCSSSCPLSLWCYLTISFSATLFSFCLQSFPASGSFPMSRLFSSGGQSIGASASASASVLPMNSQDWFPLGLIISLLSEGLSRVFSSTTIEKQQFFSAQLFFMVQLSHPYVATGKTIALNIQTFFSKAMSLLFNMLSRFLIAFHPRSKYLLFKYQNLLVFLAHCKENETGLVTEYHNSYLWSS